MTEFIEWLRREGYKVVDHGDCWTLWPKGEPVEPGYRTLIIEKDTDEEQPELREWCETEARKEGWNHFRYFQNEHGRWTLYMTHDTETTKTLDCEIRPRSLASEWADTKTKAAINALMGTGEKP